MTVSIVSMFSLAKVMKVSSAKWPHSVVGNEYLNSLIYINTRYYNSPVGMKTNIKNIY